MIQSPHGASGGHQLNGVSQDASTPQRSYGAVHPNSQAGLNDEGWNRSTQAPTILRDRPVSQHLITGQLKSYHRHSFSDYPQRSVRPYYSMSKSSESARPAGYDSKGGVVHDGFSQHAFQDESSPSKHGPTQLLTTREQHRSSGSLLSADAHRTSAYVIGASEPNYRQGKRVNGLGVPQRSPKRPISYPNKAGDPSTMPVQTTQLVIGESRRGYSVAHRPEQHLDSVPLTSIHQVLALKPLPPPPPPSKSPLETHPLLERGFTRSSGNKKTVHYAALI